MSHQATYWAIRLVDVPLDERMVLIYLADAHCPDNGCRAAPERLARVAGVDLIEMSAILRRLQARDLIVPVEGTDKWVLAFEQSSASRVGRAPA